jgi:hypothetical protein
MKLAKGYIRNVSMDAILDETSLEEFPDDPGKMPIVHALRWQVAALSVVPIQQDPHALTMSMEAPRSTQHAPAADAASAAASAAAPAASK